MAPPDDPPDDPAADPDAAPASDLRGKDLLTRSREEVEAALDPQTLAQLSSWFDRPSAVLVQERIEAEQAATEEAAPKPAIEADPRLMAILHRHNEIADNILPKRPDVKLHLDERVVPQHVRAALDRMEPDAVPDAREYSQPEDIAHYLDKDNAPQAILRDLYRPVAEWQPRFDLVFDPDEVPPLRREPPMGEPLEIPWIGRALDALYEARQKFVSIAREPWEDHLAAVIKRRDDDRAARERGE